MQVQIQLFATLTEYLPKDSGGKAINLEVEPGTSVKQLLQDLQVPRDMVKLIFKNGLQAQDKDILEDKDRIGVFPPIGGG